MTHAFSNYPGDPPDDGPRLGWWNGKDCQCPGCCGRVAHGDVVDLNLDGTLLQCGACVNTEYPRAIGEFLESAGRNTDKFVWQPGDVTFDDADDDADDDDRPEDLPGEGADIDPRDGSIFGDK